MKFFLVFLLVAHGVAHIVGFVSMWQLGDPSKFPYQTTILGGHVDLGDAGARVLGVLYLGCAVAFVVAAAAYFVRAPWWPPLFIATVSVSLVLCMVNLPLTKIGLAVNLVLLAIYAFLTTRTDF